MVKADNGMEKAWVSDSGLCLNSSSAVSYWERDPEPVMKLLFALVSSSVILSGRIIATDVKFLTHGKMLHRGDYK